MQGLVLVGLGSLMSWMLCSVGGSTGMLRESGFSCGDCYEAGGFLATSRFALKGVPFSCLLNNTPPPTKNKKKVSSFSG